MKHYTDGKKFEAIINNGIKHHVATPHKVYKANFLSTNDGLVIGLNIYLTQVIDALGFIIDKGHELGSEDEKDALKSRKKFERILNSKALKSSNDTYNNVNYEKNRKVLLNQLQASKEFFYNIKDQKNPAYHNKYYYDSIILYNGKKIYTNDNIFSQYLWEKKSLQLDMKLPKELKNHDKGNKHSIFCNVPNMSKSHIINDDKKELTSTKTKMNKILAKDYNISCNESYKLMDNPNASLDTDMPRVVDINGIKFFYNPKKVPLKHVLYGNVPFLPNDQDSYDVIDDKDDSLYEY